MDFLCVLHHCEVIEGFYLTKCTCNSMAHELATHARRPQMLSSWLEDHPPWVDFVLITNCCFS